MVLYLFTVEFLHVFHVYFILTVLTHAHYSFFFSLSALQESLNQNFLLIISHRETKKDYSLNFPGSRTIQEVSHKCAWTFRTSSPSETSTWPPYLQSHTKKLSVTRSQAYIILLYHILVSPNSFHSIGQTPLAYLSHRFIIHYKWSHFQAHNYSRSCGLVQPRLSLPIHCAFHRLSLGSPGASLNTEHCLS